MIHILYLRNSNVLTKNYKWVKKEITILGVVFGKLIRISIPYWISRSKITAETRQAIDDFYNKLNREQ